MVMIVAVLMLLFIWPDLHHLLFFLIFGVIYLSFILETTSIVRMLLASMTVFCIFEVTPRYVIARLVL